MRALAWTSMSTRAVFECMASPSRDKQTARYKSTHDWLVRLAMDLAVLCMCFSGVA